MKILFLGGTAGNSGPSNVNKGIVRNLTPNFWYARSRNKYINMAEILWKCLFSDMIVVSGLSRQGMIATVFTKLLGKKTAYIMHGCAEYEVVLNRLNGCENALKQERVLLKHADLLLPVSRKFREWLSRRYPHYAHKMGYLHNGIDLNLSSGSRDMPRKKGSIAAAGADREIKNNIRVVRAVEEMQGKAQLTVYGYIYRETPEGLVHTRYTGVIPHEAYVRGLQETELFVVNSSFETFSISAVEALCCGCSVLISENVGVSEILDLEEPDIIHDPMDVGEIREKIEYLLEHPNNQRIMSKLDLNEYSYAKSVERLEQMCLDLLNGRCPVEK